MSKKDELDPMRTRYYHFRFSGEGNEKYGTYGGATVCVTPLDAEKCVFGVAICQPMDHFERKVGVKNAKINATNNANRLMGQMQSNNTQVRNEAKARAKQLIFPISLMADDQALAKKALQIAKREVRMSYERKLEDILNEFESKHLMYSKCQNQKLRPYAKPVTAKKAKTTKKKVLAS